MKLSVVLPVYNEAAYIKGLLEDLSRQHFDGSLELIIADANSTDNTVTLARQWHARLPLYFTHNPPQGPAQTRNEGAAVATGEWLLFLDADVRLPYPNFLQVMVDETVRRGLGTSAADIRLDPRRYGWLDRAGLALQRRWMALLARTRHPVALGMCILTRADVFRSVGGFDTTVAMAEDYDYVSRASSKGFGFISRTYFYADLRRYRQEGTLKVFVRAILYEIYRLTHGFRIERDPFNYRFGQHK